ncbi:hypothetical protein TNIN_207281 [Trichonephila inaurata madagascariensis]|uniref:Uncharacterized protein n=1 Tax=Trichonephila inaurata madagascariensis TaxID=2747483 RepID=A0A8X6XL39_9ARAC|nr:hypothetical protein TNIN_207281 [Trichonephila inaurata madagascariensis]
MDCRFVSGSNWDHTFPSVVIFQGSCPMLKLVEYFAGEGEMFGKVEEKLRKQSAAVKTFKKSWRTKLFCSTLLSESGHVQKRKEP